VSEIFQSAQNFWAKLKTFLNLYKVPKIIRQHKILQSVQKFWAAMIFFNPYDLPMHPENSKNRLKSFLGSWERFPWIFSSIKLFQGYQSFNQKWNISNLYNLPKIFGQKNILKLLKKCQVSWKTFLKNSQECPEILSSTGKKIPKFPQTAQTFWVVWENPLMWTVQQRVKLTPSYEFYFIHVCLFLYFNHFDPRIKEGLNGIKIYAY